MHITVQDYNSQSLLIPEIRDTGDIVSIAQRRVIFFPQGHMDLTIRSMLHTCAVIHQAGESVLKLILVRYADALIMTRQFVDHLVSQNELPPCDEDGSAFSPRESPQRPGRFPG